jgi:hypothetical protein
MFLAVLVLHWSRILQLEFCHENKTSKDIQIMEVLVMHPFSILFCYVVFNNVKLLFKKCDRRYLKILSSSSNTANLIIGGEANPGFAFLTSRRYRSSITTKIIIDSYNPL